MFAAALLLTLLAPPLQEKAEPDDPIAKAAERERRGDLPGAARAIEEAIALRPKDVALRVRAGLLLARSDDLAGALAHLEAATSLDPAHREAWLALGETHYRAQRYTPALAAFERAAEIGDADGRAANGIGTTRFAMADRAGARAALEIAASRNPRLPGPRHLLGRIALDDGDVETAITWFRACLALDPRDPESLFRLGLSLQRRGDSEDAIRAYRAAIENDPFQLGARMNLGRLLLALGREVEGRAEIEAHGRVARGQQRLTLALESLKLDPASAPNRVLVGEALLDLGVPAEALVHFREALRSTTPQPRAHLGAARAFAALGDTERRDRAARDAIAAAPRDEALAAEAEALLRGEGVASRPGR